jgi:hypothetical protein
VQDRLFIKGRIKSLTFRIQLKIVGILFIKIVTFTEKVYTGAGRYGIHEKIL